MRKKVINAVIINKEGKILLLHRTKDRKNFPDLWHTCSGTLEGKETPEQCLKREINEELGITDYTIIKRGERMDNITLPGIIFEVWTFLIKTDEEIKIVDKHEHDNFMWITPKEIKKLKIIKGFKDNLKSVGVIV